MHPELSATPGAIPDTSCAPELAPLDVPAEHVVRSSHGRGWRGVDVAEVVHPEDDFALPAIPRHVLVVNLAGAMDARDVLAGRAGHLGPGGLAILPALAPSAWRLHREGEVRHLHLYVAPDFVATVADEMGLAPERTEIVGAVGARDALVEQMALGLLAEVRAEGPGGRLYADSLATALTIQLLRRHSSARVADDAPSALTDPAGLPAVALKRATDYIEENLARDLSLAEVASAAGYSPYHFARLFKASTGSSPHQYVIRRRVERARLLLATTDWPLAAVARHVGFASASHLALHVRRLTGASPGELRGSRRGGA